MTASPKGWPDQAKCKRDGGEHTTVQPVRLQQHALDVVAHLYAQLIATDAVDSATITDVESTVITAAAHAAQRGDIIRFTSGTHDKREVRVRETDTNTITLVEKLSAAPAAAVTFQILRQTTPVVDSSGNLSISIAAADGLAYADSARYDHTVPVTTLAWTQLIAATAADIEELYIWDSSGQCLEIGIGAPASEARKFLIPPGGINGPIRLHIAGGSRIAVRAVSADTAGGSLVLTGLG